MAECATQEQNCPECLKLIAKKLEVEVAFLITNLGSLMEKDRTVRTNGHRRKVGILIPALTGLTNSKERDIFAYNCDTCGHVEFLR